MSSILTNTSAMVALQTLNGINKNLSSVQNEIATGKSVSSAKDNSAVWAISQVMQSDVDGFNAISDSLSLGQSTVAVGRNAAESVSGLLGQIKEKVVAAQEDNVDRAKLQTDVDSLRDQISGIVSAAQFNGQNLLSNTSTTAGEGTVNVLSSLDRSSDGSVASSSISVTKADLGTGDLTLGTTAGTDGSVSATAALADGATATYDMSGASSGAGAGFSFDMSIVGGTGTADYVMREGETVADANRQLVSKINFEMASQDISGFSFAANGTDVTITNNSGSATAALANDDIDVTTGGTIGGGLELLGDIDISTGQGATAALAAMEGLTQTAITAASQFGTGEKRLEIQADFVSKLVDSMKTGIGALVDANMEEASAKLQALQVQQQLGIQSLSIANQSPQSVLSLFR